MALSQLLLTSLSPTHVLSRATEVTLTPGLPPPPVMGPLSREGLGRRDVRPGQGCHRLKDALHLQVNQPVGASWGCRNNLLHIWWLTTAQGCGLTVLGIRRAETRVLRCPAPPEGSGSERVPSASSGFWGLPAILVPLFLRTHCSNLYFCLYVPSSLGVSASHFIFFQRHHSC